MNKTCPYCKTIFKTYSSKQIFCSITCGQKNRHPKTKSNCLQCGIEFVVMPGKSGRKLFCCLRCFHNHNIKDKVPVVCKNCGKTAYFSPGDAKHRTNCSKKCKYERLSRENSERFKGINKGEKSPTYKDGIGTYARSAMEYFQNECITCHRSDISFEVHHIDGNRRNNTMNNLVIMCLNCHRRLHKATKTHDLSLNQSLEFVKLTGHLPKVKHYLRLKGVAEEIAQAVEVVKTQYP